MLLDKAILDEHHNVVPIERTDEVLPHTDPKFVEWCIWMNDVQNRRVAATYINNRKRIWVSTVFLGLNHSFFPGGERWFETMVFGTSMDGYCERYQTWKAAERGHARIVGYAKRARQVRQKIPKRSLLLR